VFVETSFKQNVVALAHEVLEPFLETFGNVSWESMVCKQSHKGGRPVAAVLSSTVYSHNL
jgi:hypothetical protein